MEKPQASYTTFAPKASDPSNPAAALLDASESSLLVLNSLRDEFKVLSKKIQLHENFLATILARWPKHDPTMKALGVLYRDAKQAMGGDGDDVGIEILEQLLGGREWVEVNSGPGNKSVFGNSKEETARASLSGRGSKGRGKATEPSVDNQPPTLEQDCKMDTSSTNGHDQVSEDKDKHVESVASSSDSKPEQKDKAGKQSTSLDDAAAETTEDPKDGNTINSPGIAPLVERALQPRTLNISDQPSAQSAKTEKPTDTIIEPASAREKGTVSPPTAPQVTKASDGVSSPPAGPSSSASYLPPPLRHRRRNPYKQSTMIKLTHLPTTITAWVLSSKIRGGPLAALLLGLDSDAVNAWAKIYFFDEAAASRFYAVANRLEFDGRRVQAEVCSARPIFGGVMNAYCRDRARRVLYVSAPSPIFAPSATASPLASPSRLPPASPLLAPVYAFLSKIQRSRSPYAQQRDHGFWHEKVQAVEVLEGGYKVKIVFLATSTAVAVRKLVLGMSLMERSAALEEGENGGAEKGKGKGKGKEGKEGKGKEGKGKAKGKASGNGKAKYAVRYGADECEGSVRELGLEGV